MEPSALIPRGLFIIAEPEESGGAFIRSGEADEPMSEYEIYAMEAFKRRIHDDIRTMDDTPCARYRKELIGEYWCN